MKVLKHLLIAGFIATFGLGSVQAEFTPNPSEVIELPDSDGSSRTRGTDIYIVQLKGDPVIAYNGDLAGYAATRPAKGQKLAQNSAAVKKYAGRLMSIQNDIIASVGATKVYNYLYALNGFAARMNADTAEKLRKRRDVMNVWKNEILPKNTNTSPAWIGVSGTGNAWRGGYTGENVVVGSIDTGIWPEHPSFADVRTPILGDYGPWLYLDGMPSGFYPSGCDLGDTTVGGGGGTGLPNGGTTPSVFTCSKKLVAARCFNQGFSDGPGANPCGGNGSQLHPDEFLSARDYDGHGSHTAATAAGNYGVKAVIDGERLGRVSGIAPRARVATYKVCWDGPDPSVTTDDGCATVDSTAAVDWAVYDGVDVINYSVGGSSTAFGGSTNIAYLFAADAGVFVATSNGNAGPNPQTTGTPSGVPWITSVGATQDDGVFYSAITVNAPAGLAGIYVAVEGTGDVTLEDTGIITQDVVLADDGTGVTANACEPLINGAAMAGKIALVVRGLCGFIDKYDNAAAAGAVAIIVYNDGTNPGRIDPISMGGLGGATIPGVMIGFYDGDALANASGVNVTLDPANAVSAASRIAGFSSRGPNGGMPDVIKPDVSAPGVAILAAETPAQNGAMFQSINGTSMASPHAAGAFALIKQKHPDWSPAQAKSALMTTGRQDLKKTFGETPADAFDIGSGEIRPTGALSPGLTFDTGFFDYLDALCGEPQQANVVGAAYCSSFSMDPSDLNLASIGIASFVGSQTVTRTVTNIGTGYGKWRRKSYSTYEAVVDAPPGILVLLSDWELNLRGGESATYQVTFKAKKGAVLDEWAFGSITWVEKGGDHRVRSTVAIRPVSFFTETEADGFGTSGAISVPVSFGYDGKYYASVDGFEASFATPPGNLGPGDVDAWCADLPAMTHFRAATFDQDSSDPGNDDIDIQMWYKPNGCGAGPFQYYGGSLGATSEEEINFPNAPAGGYHIQVYYFSASNGTDTDYTLWYQPVISDNGNTSVTAPGPNVSIGDAGNVTVNYSGLDPTRNLGVLIHEDEDGEIGRTIMSIDN